MYCRMIYTLKKFDHITLYFQQLHWLKVLQQIQYRYPVLLYQCKDGMVQTYLSDMVLLCSGGARMLHSHSSENFITSMCNKTQNVAFHGVGPRVWNSLLALLKSCDSLETFKKYVKTLSMQKIV